MTECYFRSPRCFAQQGLSVETFIVKHLMFRVLLFNFHFKHQKSPEFPGLLYVFEQSLIIKILFENFREIFLVIFIEAGGIPGENIFIDCS